MEFYFVASSVRKSVWTLVRQLRGPHLKKGLASMAVPPLEKSASKEPGNAMYQKARSILQQTLSKNPSIEGADEARRVLQSLGAGA